MTLTRCLSARAFALSLVLAPATASAAGDDWSLQRSASDPALVQQRLKKLHRSPFDTRHWSALRKSIGLDGLSKKITAGLARSPRDVNWQILDARIDLARGQNTRAADKLAALELAAGRRAGGVFELRVTALERSADWGTLVSLLEDRAGSAKNDKARVSLLTRAYGFADRGRRSEDALRIAGVLVELAPADRRARLRLARAATDAGQPGVADAAYQEAITRASGSSRLDLQAERARARLEADNPAGASELLWSMLENPTRGSRAAREMWWSTLENAHRRARSTDALLTKLGPWLDTHDDEAAAWRTLASAQQSAGIDSIEAWRRARALSPRDAETATALIEALETKGRHEDAAREVRSMLEGGSRDPTLAIELATNLAAAGERELAFGLAGEVEQRFARSAKALTLLLDFYNLNDDAEHALEVARALVKLGPRQPEARIALGEQLHQMRRTKDALEQWGMLPKLVRPPHKGWARHAQVLSEHDLTVEAIASIHKAMKQSPGQPEYLRLRAVLAEEQRKPMQALGLWQETRRLATSAEHKLLRDEARTRTVELLVGSAHTQRRERLARAVAESEVALNKGQPREQALEAGRFLAELHTRQEHYGAAVRVQQRMLSLDPDDPGRLEQLAGAQRRAGQVESAMGTLEELLEVEPGRGPDVLAEMSELAFEAGDNDRALKTATTAAQKDRTHVDAIVRLGEMHESKGDIEAAAHAYRTALETTPGALRPKLRLAELELTRGNVERSRTLLAEILESSGPAELMEEAGRRALDLAEAADELEDALTLAVRRSAQHPEADEPRQFLLDALDRLDTPAIRGWLGAREGTERRQGLRVPLIAALGRGSITTRLRAAEHLGRLGLPDTAAPLATLGKNLAAPRDATPTVQAAYERARLTAIRSAGALQDPAAVSVFVEVLESSRYSWGARRTAAWALARTQTPAGAEALIPHLRLGDDAHVVALACIAAAERTATELGGDALVRVRQVAHESRNPTVRHACTYAHAALTTPSELGSLRTQVEHTDPLVASAAAWRIGNAGPPTTANVEALLRRAIGPGGLARDAAAAALVQVLDPEQRQAPGVQTAPPAPRGDAWSAAVERWLQRRVVPSVEPIAAEDLEAHPEAIEAAVNAAKTGTSAERAAAQKVQRSCTDGAAAALCLPAVARDPVAIPN